MKITIHDGIQDFADAEGVGVIIDVFRATTTIACLITSKPDRILVLPDARDISLYAGREGFACFSELVEEGFDNSPITALKTLLKGKTAVISTTNGTRGILAATHCSKLITASFVNFEAVVDFLIELSPERVSLLPVGQLRRTDFVAKTVDAPDHVNLNKYAKIIVPEGFTSRPAIEDTLCAVTIRNRLSGMPIDEKQIRKILLRRIKDRPLNHNSPTDHRIYADMLFCCSMGIIDTVPEVFFKGGEIFIREGFQPAFQK